MKTSKKINRIIAGSLSLAIVSSMTSVFPAFAEVTESADFVYDDYSVSYNVTNAWGNTEKVSITLTNTGEKPIENWMLYFDPNGEVTSMWDVTTASTANNVTYFKNAGYNSTIVPNDSVTFSYFVDNCEAIPESYTLCQKRVEKSEGYNVEVVVDNSWGEGFNGTIIITNSTDKPIADWELVFDTNFTITEITSSWSGTMTALEPYSYMLKGSYTSVIEPNSSVRLGFSGVKDGNPIITDTVLTEVVADEALINFKSAYPDGVELYAFGNYNNKDNAVDIGWYTNYTNGDYEIWTSDDNSTYTSVAVVSDSTEYQYPITENFEKRYFKVSLDVGFDECIESVPFVVTKSETGYSVDFLDSDEDGLPDIFELQLGTNVNEPDSDSDGLTDYQEVYITGTDPTVYDSVTSGVSDADADSDGDGLSNAQEIELGTNPQLSDTDDDGLSDYDEIYVYQTDPINPDSDDDGLQDGDEPHIGLDPTNPETFGTPDAEYKIVQTVQADSETLSYINTAENPYSLSISLNAAGYAENALSAEISSYTNVLSSNTAIVGNIVSLDYLYDDIEDVTLNFEMSSEYLNSMGETTVEGLELEGINRLYAFYYDEVNNILYPVETEISGNTVVVHASELGDYCLIDLNTWLEMLDISSAEDEEIAEPDVYSIKNYSETEEIVDTEKVFQDDVVIVDETVPSNYEKIIEEQINDVIENIKAEESIGEETETISTFSTYADTNNSRKKIDLVYVIDTSGSMSNAISAAKSSMTTLVNNLYSNGIDANVAVVTYSDYGCDGTNGAIIHYANGSNWARNAAEAQALINTVSLYGCGHETPLDGLEMAHRLNFHNDAVKFMVLITDEPYEYSNNRFGIATMQELADDLKDDTIYTSVVCYDRDASGYAPLYNTTKGIQINLSSNWPEYLENYIKTYIKELTSFTAVSSFNFSPIKLDAVPDRGSDVDSDEDGLCDWQEINWNFIDETSDELVLPTLSEYFTKIYGRNMLNMLPIPTGLRNKVNAVLIMPILTDPTNPDTDEDGYKDGKAYIENGIELLPKDPHPLKYEIIPYLEDLCDIALDYEKNFEKSQKLVIDYIRAGKYDDDEPYDSGMWENTSGKIDDKFIKYVNEKNPNIKNYLYSQDSNDTKYIKDPITGELIDFTHLAATFSAYLFDTSGFKMWVGSTFKDTPKYTEDDINNLAGWAGDLQSMIQTDLLIYYDDTRSENWYGDHYFDVKVLNKYDENYYKDLVLKLLSDEPQYNFDSSTHILLDDKRIRNTSFKIEDQLSDIDAVNMFINFYRPSNKTTIFDCINGYYSKIDGKRFCKDRYNYFIDNLFSTLDDHSYDFEYFDLRSEYWDGNITRDEFKSEVVEMFYTYILKYTMENTPDGKKWTLYYNAPVTENVSKGAAKAFAEYIVNNWSF